MFELVRSNQRKSILLALVMSALLAVIGYFVGELLVYGGGSAGVGFALVLSVGLFFVSYYAGSGILLRTAGAREVEKQDAPQLYNVVEEMVIASGLRHTPKVYVIETTAANAFATGRAPEVSAVAVTEGLLSILNRAELQGVIAHEIAHVKNRDVLFMTLLSVMAGSIGLLSEGAKRFLFYGGFRRRSRSSSNNSGARGIVLIIGLVLLIVGPLIARLIYLAASRSREYLADASSAIFTRNPGALAEALRKIGRNVPAHPLPLPKVARGMLIVGAPLFGTHPPLERRVAVLEALAGSAQLSYRAYAGFYARETGKRARFVPESAVQQAAVPSMGLQRLSKAEPNPAGAALRREALDSVKKRAGYRLHTCACGSRIKAPAAFPRDKKLQCALCGRPVPR